MSEDAPAAEATPSAEEQTPPSEETQAPENDRTYTQKDIDRILGKVRAEERARFSNYDEFREKAERYDELAEQGKSAEQKLQESLANRERELEELRGSHQRTLVTSATVLASGKHNVVDPEAVAKLLDWDQIEYDEAGRPTNVDDLVAELVADKPYLTAKPSRGPTFDGGARQQAPLTTDDPKAALGVGLLGAIDASRGRT